MVKEDRRELVVPWSKLRIYFAIVNSLSAGRGLKRPPLNDNVSGWCKLLCLHREVQPYVEFRVG